VKNVEAELPCIMPRDIVDLQEFGVPNNVEFVSMSFTKSAEDVRQMRCILDGMGLQNTKIIAKIERKSALVELEEIVQVKSSILNYILIQFSYFFLMSIVFVNSKILIKYYDGFRFRTGSCFPEGTWVSTSSPRRCSWRKSTSCSSATAPASPAS
jgi:hypothetical protein